jgi:bifunctional ADP-heptose synthase (sugar kinase/adenylyltransferase)
MITMTMVAGRVLMRDRQLLTLDVEEITAHSRERAAEVWKRYTALVPRDADA